MNELSYRFYRRDCFIILDELFFVAASTFFAINYILIESRLDIASSAHGSIISIFRYAHRDNYRSLMCGPNITGGNIDILRPRALGNRYSVSASTPVVEAL